MRFALVLFGFGLVLRVLFWLATGDRWDAFAVVFQGDAPVWRELAICVSRGLDNELLRLPLRPPGQQWLVSALWDGSMADAWRVRLVFVVLGALVAPLVYLLVRRHVAENTARMAGVLCAASSPLLALGSGPHSELPYLVLVLVSLFGQEWLGGSHPRRSTVLVALGWGALHGVICLLRAEHALTFVAFLGVLAWQHAARWRSAVVLAVLAFVLALVPWHFVAWQKVDRYNNTEPTVLLPAGPNVRGGLPWGEGALARLDTLPPFLRRPMFHFVTATVRVRGGVRVGAEDLDVIREGYGVWPEAVPKPFVCLYGGLNFFLANSPEADGGFSGAALDRLPPLARMPGRFPPGWEGALPGAGTLGPGYVPHLGRIVNGYGDGFGEMVEDPAGAARRVGTKLWYAAEGAAGGFGGYAVPIGLSGVRRSVDMVTATGVWAVVWRVAMLAAAVAGLWRLRRESWLMPWIAFALTKVIIVAAFFGYARQGALVVPVVMLGVAVLLERACAGALRPRGLWIVLAVLLSAELVRTFTVEVAVELPDGRPAMSLPPSDHREIRVEYGWR